MNVVVLGDPKVGKTSLLKAIVSGSTKSVELENQPLESLMNTRKSANQEVWKHRLDIGSGVKLPIAFHDTKNKHYSSSVS